VLVSKLLTEWRSRGLGEVSGERRLLLEYDRNARNEGECMSTSMMKGAQALMFVYVRNASLEQDCGSSSNHKCISERQPGMLQ
jgi:hypothetical protein